MHSNVIDLTMVFKTYYSLNPREAVGGKGGLSSIKKAQLTQHYTQGVTYITDCKRGTYLI